MSAEQQEQLREKSAKISKALLTAVTEMDGILAHSAESGRNMAEQSENVMRDSEDIGTLGKMVKDIREMSEQLDMLVK